MGWLTSPDPDEFLKAADGFLRSSGAEGTLLLSAAHAVRGLDPLFGWWVPDRSGSIGLVGGGGVRAAFLDAPRVPVLIIGRIPELAASLAQVLYGSGRPVRGVDASPGAADAFAAAWTHRTGMVARMHRHFRVYRMTGPLPDHPGPAGRPRIAVPQDRPLLAEWLRAFGNETGEFSGTLEKATDDLIAYGGAIFWEVDGRPAAVAAITRPVEHAVRITIVYSPPEFRHRGYASAAMVAASRAALSRRNQVREVILISDRASPVRRAQRLGYELAGERILLWFDPPAGPMVRLTGPMTRLRADLGAPTGPIPRLTGPMPRLSAPMAGWGPTDAAHYR